MCESRNLALGLKWIQLLYHELNKRLQGKPSTPLSYMTYGSNALSLFAVWATNVSLLGNLQFISFSLDCCPPFFVLVNWVCTAVRSAVLFLHQMLALDISTCDLKRFALTLQFYYTCSSFAHVGLVTF